MTSYQYPQKSMNVVLATFKEILADVMNAIETGTIEQVLQQIAGVSRDLVQARYAALGIPDGNGGLRYFKTAGLTDDEIARIPHPPIGKGLLGAIMNEREILRLKTMQLDHRSVGFPENHPEMTSLLGVPVLVGNQLFGMLYLCDRLDGEPFDDEDQWLVESFAGYAALAIAGMQLSEQQSRLTLLEERERVGMELHDGVIQSLYAIGMQLQLILLSENIANDQLHTAIGNIDNVISDIRRYILNLKSANFQQVTIKQCIEGLILRLHVPAKITIHIEAQNETPKISPVVLEAVCQITLEALSNAIRHAKARNITISASQDDTHFTMQVRDDGIGFDIDQASKANGLGLHNIKQRARLHRGDVEINTEIGKGTELKISVPNS